MKYIDVLKKMLDQLEDVIDELTVELDMVLEDAKSGIKEIKTNIESILEESGYIDDNVVLDQIKELEGVIEDFATEEDITLDKNATNTPLFQSLHNDASSMRYELDDSHLMKPKPYGQI